MENTEKFDEMIRGIFAADTLHECGRRLEAFAREMDAISDPEELADVSVHFWRSMNKSAAVNLDFGDPENHGWMVCPPEQRVASYLDISLVPRPTPEEDAAYLLETAEELQRDYDGRQAPGLDQEDFKEVMDFLNENYDYNSLVLNHQKAVAIFFRDVTKTNGHQCVFRFHGARGWLCPHFLFFGLSGLDGFSMAVASPVYHFLYELAIAMVAAAFAVFENGELRFHFPPEIVSLAAERSAGFEEEDAQGQAAILEMGILAALMEDSPFPAPLLALSAKRDPDESRHAHELLAAVLDVLREKRKSENVTTQDLKV